MSVQNICWEDEENNRLIDLQVKYGLVDGQVEIESVTPNAVTFVKPACKSAIRKIGVHTAKGRFMLRQQYETQVGLENLRNRISSEHTIEA